ncbi:MAG: hypothetical protein HPY66_2268 [Firmicutes bacterium]|nr:hypothetical protein [Bacillota bacterium]
MNEAIKLSQDFYYLGARKITLLGGEPTLYYQSDYRYLLTLVEELHNIGYTEIRIDTNGFFDEILLSYEKLKELCKLNFSLDGYNQETNDYLRSHGSFDVTIRNIIAALKAGFYVSITSCVHNFYVKHREKYNIVDMMKYCENLGVKSLNFHVLLKHGIPMDAWTESVLIEYNDWENILQQIRAELDRVQYKMEIRIPLQFVDLDTFNSNKSYYGFCPVKLGERVLVHPDGLIQICSAMIGSQYCIAKYHNNEIKWEEGFTNEAYDHKLNIDTPCTHRMKYIQNENIVPLCFSFKP